MARYIELHPVNPQVRLIEKIVDRIRQGQIGAIPTDSGYALVCGLGNKAGLERITKIRKVGEHHHFTLLCHNFAQLGKLVIIDNSFFRLIKSLTPGPYTFILKGTKEVPKIMLNPKKATVGARIPAHLIVQMIVEELGEPLQSSTLILPGETDPISEAWVVQEKLDHELDFIVDGPVESTEPTTVLDLSAGELMIAREGAGDISAFS